MNITIAEEKTDGSKSIWLLNVDMKDGLDATSIIAMLVQKLAQCECSVTMNLKVKS